MSLARVFARGAVVVELHTAAPAVLVPLSPGLLHLVFALGLSLRSGWLALVAVGGLESGY